MTAYDAQNEFSRSVAFAVASEKGFSSVKFSFFILFYSTNSQIFLTPQGQSQPVCE